MPEEITAEELFECIEAYRPSASSQSSLAESEPYLLAPVTDGDGDIHVNGDFLIEDLTDADLDCSDEVC